MSVAICENCFGPKASSKLCSENYPLLVLPYVPTQPCCLHAYYVQIFFHCHWGWIICLGNCRFYFFWLGFLNPGFLVLTLPQISSKGNNPVMWTIHNFFCVSLFDRDPLLQINPDCCSTLFCLTSVSRVGREVIIRIYKPNHHLLHTFFLFDCYWSKLQSCALI